MSTLTHIRVAVRMRPYLTNEIQHNDSGPIILDEDEKIVKFF